MAMSMFSHMVMIFAQSSEEAESLLITQSKGDAAYEDEVTTKL